MMNGLQLIAKLQGRLKPDEARVQNAVQEFTQDYPHGILVISDDRLSVQVSVEQDGDKVLCMKCGNPMVDRVNQYFKNGVWVKKARKDNISNWECPHCFPGAGGAPLMAGCNTAQDVTEAKEG